MLTKEKEGGKMKTALKLLHFSAVLSTILQAYPTIVF